MKVPLLADQFIACGKSRDVANELASQIWIAVLDNLEENEHTFLLLKRLAQEADVSYCWTTILLPGNAHSRLHNCRLGMCTYALHFSVSTGL